MLKINYAIENLVSISQKTQRILRKYGIRYINDVIVNKDFVNNINELSVYGLNEIFETIDILYKQQESHRIYRENIDKAIANEKLRRQSA